LRVGDEVTFTVGQNKDDRPVANEVQVTIGGVNADVKSVSDSLWLTGTVKSFNPM